MKRLARLVSLVFGLMWLVSCGGGGGGGTSIPPIAETAAAWWVAEPAAAWHYVVTDTRPGAPAKADNVVRVGSRALVDGLEVVDFEHSRSIFDNSAYVERRAFDGRAILAVGEIGVGGAAAVEGSYAEVPAPLLADTPIQVLDRTEYEDLDGDGRADAIRIRIRVALGLEALVEVPAGRFRDVLRGLQSVEATVESTALGQSFTATALLTTWYAPGVGVIRRSFEDPSAPVGARTVTEELNGVSLAALKAGVLKGFTALDAIGAGQDSSTPGAPALAAAGESFLVVSGAPVSGSTGAQAVFSLRGIDGAERSRGAALLGDASALFGPQMVGAAFDGENYRVFLGRPDSAIVAQRITRAGVLLDPIAGMPTGKLAGTGALGGFAVAADPAAGSVLLAWKRYDDTLVEVSPGLFAPRGYVIEGQLLGRGGEPLAGVFSLGPCGLCGEPIAVTVQAGQYLVVLGAPQDQLSVARINASGVPIDLEPAALTAATAIRYQPDAAGIPTGYLVQWLERPTGSFGAVAALKAARLTPERVLLDGTPEVPGAVLVPEVSSGLLASGASGPWSVWTDTLSGSTMIGGAYLRQGILGAPLSVSAAPAFRAAPIRLNPYLGTSEWWALGPVVAAAPPWGVVVGWLENLQSFSSPSDRVAFALSFPRADR